MKKWSLFGILFILVIMLAACSGETEPVVNDGGANVASEADESAETAQNVSDEDTMAEDNVTEVEQDAGSVSRPDWHFVIIGDADSNIDLTPYRNMPNMHFLGRKPYRDLPAYCRQFDVGLIPFVVNDLTRAVNPIKLREMLAAGCPVVATQLQEVAAWCESKQADGACVAADSGAFVAAVRRLVAQAADPERRAAISRSVSDETWEQKVREILECVNGAG